MSIDEPTIQRESLCLPRERTEPVVPVKKLADAIAPDDVETFRPLLPVGYRAGVAAYRDAVNALTENDLSAHYTQGVDYFHETFVPELKQRLSDLSGGQWDLDDYVAFAAGSDVDFMGHVIEAVAAKGNVALFPGDWYGFVVGCTQTDRILWDSQGKAELSCLCIPSVRNGHLTPDMSQFLANSQACLLNLNLFPTLPPDDRQVVCRELQSVLDKSILSISFSRGFGLTASQLGVALLHKDHPYVKRFRDQWNWYTYFYNGIAARAFLEFDLRQARQVDEKRASWVHTWLEDHGLPVVTTGTYYVKSFRPKGELPTYLEPLLRGDIVRLCFKPPMG